MKEEIVTILGDTSEDELYKALSNVKEYQIGTILMYYIKENFDKEDRIKAIKTILTTLFNDFFTWELPKGEVERIRSLIEKI